MFYPTLTEIENALDHGGISILMSHNKFWQVRRNGKIKTWKTRPGEFLIPVKMGYRGHTHITHRSTFCRPGDGPVAEFQIFSMVVEKRFNETLSSMTPVNATPSLTFSAAKRVELDTVCKDMFFEEAFERGDFPNAIGWASH